MDSKPVPFNKLDMLANFYEVNTGCTKEQAYIFARTKFIVDTVKGTSAGNDGYNKNPE